MNFAREYYSFKQKWYFKIGSLLFDFYICKEVNNQLERIKYDYFDDLIESYISNELIDDKEIENYIKEIDYTALNKLEYELLKHVVIVSKNYEDIKFNPSDFVYFAILLEITISIYNTTFMGVNKNVIDTILKENLFRFEFIDFKIKQSKYNILFKYIKYINKCNEYYFSNLKNKNVEINVTSLSRHHGYYIIDINNKLPNLSKYDEELIESVEKNNNFVNKLFVLNLEILIQQLVYLLEKDKLFIADHYVKDGFNDYIDKTNLIKELDEKIK